MGSIKRLTPILAFPVGVLHAGLAPIVAIGDVKPNLVLVAAVLVAATAGTLPGIAWAFIGGSTANLLSYEPLGSIPLVLIPVSALAAIAAPPFAALGVAYPVAAVFVASLLADTGTLVLRRLLSEAAAAAISLDVLVGAALLNAAIAALVIVPLRLLLANRARHRLSW